MSERYQNFNDFGDLFWFVLIRRIFKQWNEHVLDPVVIDATEFLQGMIGIEHVPCWESTQPQLHKLQQILPKLFIDVYLVFLILLPEVHEIVRRQFMQSLINELVDELPHVGIFVVQFQHEPVEAQSPRIFVIVAVLLDVLESCVNPGMLPPVELYFIK